MWILTLLLTALGCNSQPSVLDHAGRTPASPELREPTAVPLARRPDLLREVRIPQSNHPGDALPPDAFGGVAPFRKERGGKDYDRYSTLLPIRSDLLSDRMHGTHSFGAAAPPGLEVYLDQTRLRFQRRGEALHSFGFDRDRLFVTVPKGAPTPDISALTVRFPSATSDEKALNFHTADRTDEAFILRDFTLDIESHHGLFLPAPSFTEWQVRVPDQAVFTFRGTILSPAIAQFTRSDGATLIIEVVTADQTVTEIGRADLTLDRWAPHRFDLSAFSGQDVLLRLHTDPGESSAWDYAFLEGPTLYTPKEDPERVLIVFIDTLRPDHLPTYGYERPTAPKLERWAKLGTVFDEARNVAPWTLPSARAALSGRQPEGWYDGPTLADHLAAAGYHTDAFVTNAFLSQPFDTQRGWTRFRYEHLQEARWVSQHGINVLEAHPDRDVALLVHYMDPHLPYDEPRTYRRTFASGRPSQVQSLTRSWLVSVDEETEGFEEIRQYVIDRYDQNIRYVDDQLTRLLQAAGPDATVVIFSDHGEEFWEHGGFEHGHTFYDELLRVPLILRGPGVPAGRNDAPVSLLDLTPTVLDLQGLPQPDMAGSSLVPILWGDTDAEAALRARPQGFGRPLYGEDGWAVLDQRKKWVARGSTQQLFDLEQDPLEKQDRIEGASVGSYPGALSSALEREVTLAWRLQIKGRSHRSYTLSISADGGIRDGWIGYDPRGRFAHTQVEVVDDTLKVQPRTSNELPHTLFIVPKGDPLDLSGLKLEFIGPLLEVVGEPELGRVDDLLMPTPVLEKNGFFGALDHAWVPLPTGSELSGFAPEMEAQLRELGYLD